MDTNEGAKTKSVLLDVLEGVVILCSWSVANYFESHNHPLLRDVCYCINFIAALALCATFIHKVWPQTATLILIWFACSVPVAILMFSTDSSPIISVIKSQWPMIAVAGGLWTWVFMSRRGKSPALHRVIRDQNPMTSAKPPERVMASRIPTPINHKSATELASSLAAPLLAEAPNQAASYQLIGDRIIVNITPSELCDFYRQHLGIQAQKLVEPYIGKWIKLSRTIDNVDGYSQFMSLKTVRAKPEDPDLYLYFNLEWKQRLELLRRGDQITLIGQIDQVRQYNLDLHNCEIVDDSVIAKP